MLVDNCCVRFEVDTGAAKSVMSQQIFNQLGPGRSLETTKVRLVSYSNEPIPVVGQCTVNIAYKSQNAVVPLIVVKGTGPSLFGRNWLNHIRLEWQEINYVPGDAVQPVLNKYPFVFQESLGKLQGFKPRSMLTPMQTSIFQT